MPAICPETFLYRMGGGATSAAYEIWATVHRQYTILVTCRQTDTATRLFAFRCFVRLVMRYRAVLVAAAETCPLCRRDTRLSTAYQEYYGDADRAGEVNCCWYHPDARGTAVLSLLRKLGDRASQGVEVDRLAEDFYLAKLYGDRASDELLNEMYNLFE